MGDTPFRELLTHSIADDPTVSAAACALDGLIAKLAQSIPDLLIFARLAHDSGFINPVPMLAPMTRLAEQAGGLRELPTEILDLLAWQLHVESWACGVSLKAKREMLQSSLILHRRHGTPWSVRHALETLLQVPAFIRQWFEYGGEPYFFRARLNVSGTYVDIRWLLSAFQIVDDYKNVRSWLEWLETFSITMLEIRTGIGVSGLVREREMLFFPDAPMPQAQIRTGAAIRIKSCWHSFPHAPGNPPEEKICLGAGARNRTVSQISMKE